MADTIITNQPLMRRQRKRLARGNQYAQDSIQNGNGNGFACFGLDADHWVIFGILYGGESQTGAHGLPYDSLRTIRPQREAASGNSGQLGAGYLRSAAKRAVAGAGSKETGRGFGSQFAF